MFEVPQLIKRKDLPLVPTYQAVLRAGLGGLAPEITRLSGDTGEWSKVVAEAKQRPELEDLLSGIRVTERLGFGVDSEQIYHFLRGLSLAGKLVQDINSGIYRIEPQVKLALYRRNMARLPKSEEKIALLSQDLARLAS